MPTGSCLNPLYDEMTMSDWPREVHAELRTALVRQVGYVPDAGLSDLIGRCRADADMVAVGLTTEEEGVGLAIGAWLGGDRTVLLMQSSGIGNCINAFAALRICRVPLLLVVSMRGDWGETNPWQVPMGQTAEQHLETAGIVVHRADVGGDVAPTVKAGAQMAFESHEAVAILISQRVLGAKLFVDKL